MTDDRAKTPRTLLVADHLWDAFAVMAAEMGSDRDALINQALYTFARLNGFLVPADLKRLGFANGAQLGAGGAAGNSIPPSESSRPRPAPPGPAGMLAAEDRPVTGRHANPGRMAELAQQLAGSGGAPAREKASNPPPVPSAPPTPPKEASLVEVDDSLLGEEGQATSMDLPNLESLGLGKKGVPSAPISAPHRTQQVEELSDPGATATPGGRTLVIMAEGRELDRVIKERFLIGRGKHCDLIINSGKVSREHAAITREGGNYFIEDLGSSNGTWFDKRRISRRQIQDGDEYYICSEKLACTFR